MFKNILVATDGSDLSRKAARKAIGIAKSLGASVTAFHVAPAYHMDVTDDYIPRDFVLPGAYATRAKRVANRLLESVTKPAAAAGVPCAAYYAVSDFPADAIVKAAKKYKCDAIAMASHGRSGLGRLLLGSQTQKVLAHTKLPVIVLK